MRFFWKLLLVVIPIGSYWLYKKGSSQSANTEVQSDQTDEPKTTAPSARKDTATQQSGADTKKGDDSSPAKAEDLSSDQIIEQLTRIDGVTSRVAENLIERGIKSKEALLKLSEEELKSINGIGPKRAAKILILG